VPAKPKAAPQLTGPVQLDDDTRNALILFNARLVAQDELEREKRRVDKAAKAKDEAAAKVRQLENDPSATSDLKSEAQAAYLASLDALNRAKAGEPAAADTADTDAADDESDEPDETGGDVAADAPEGDETDESGGDVAAVADDAAVPDEPADAVEAPTEAADEPDPTA
jgi:hypothetical protein